MLELKNIKKDYEVAESKVHALKGISIKFRDSEFVSILGPSGCGKTTTLNIIGGLDRYSEGDLVIDNKSTTLYKDKDWDKYRNHKVGFVFQSYNLIPHQTILSNVEIALTIGNIPKEKRTKLAIEALEKVGLKNEIKKFPRQLSGGQMQRVAIARAIVNKPTILLADEPTGALDSKTSIQVLDILKELSKDCLVVMVTHNEELAKEYSSRIVTLKDGEMTGDTNPYNPTEEEINESVQKELESNKKYLKSNGKEKKVGMPFITALKLSLSNLKSKIGRTLLTCFAGSIGIIGIALILSVSNGFNHYIDDVESSTLSKYPITLEQSTVNLTSLLTSFMLQNEENGKITSQDEDTVVPNYVMVDMLRNLASSANYNDLGSFKKYLEANIAEIEDNLVQIKYNYNVDLNVYKKDVNSESESYARKLKPFDIPDTYQDGSKIYMLSEEFDSNYMEGFMGQVTVWSELYDEQSILDDQYNLIKGKWAQAADEVVLVVDKNCQISDFDVYSLGLADNGDDYIRELFKFVNGMRDTDPKENEFKDIYKWTLDELIGKDFYIVPNSSFYKKDDVTSVFNPNTGKDVETFTSIKEDSKELVKLFSEENDNIVNVKIVGIVQPNPNSDTHSIGGAIGYTKALTERIIEINNNSEIVKSQKANDDYCLINFYEGLETKGKTWTEIKMMLEFAKQMGGNISDALIEQFSKENMLNQMYTSYYGEVDKENPSSISLYPNSFDDKDAIISFIEKYNQSLSEEDQEKRITYNDYLSSIMGSVTTIVNAITYVLIAFVSISLVVSSIMIAIITYISVLERTKEIGILRAMGASKRDVKNIFNAETFITGFISGILGVLITIVLNIPLSLIIKHLSGISNMAVLPIAGGVALVIISFLLSIISGLIPSSYAAKCDPVIALRSE